MRESPALSLPPYLKRHRFVILALALFTLHLSGCTYRLGSPERVIPGGYRQISVPIFKNYTQETGIEVAFTNALIGEFERSRTARVVDPRRAEAQVDGEIVSIIYQASGDTVAATLPENTVLRTNYRILLTVRVTLRRRSDQNVLWSGQFEGERTYTAPQVTAAGINTVNPLYNLSARRQNINVMAGDLMAEAHDRMLESF